MRNLIVTFVAFMAVLVVSDALGKSSEKLAFDTQVIEQQIGKAGEVKGDVYKISLPRSDLEVNLDGIKLKPGFALGSWMAFKAAGKGTVAHGDLVLTEEELPAVIADLEQHGIQITGVHNHLVHESPRVMYVHFWGSGAPQALAQALKSALSLTKTPVESPKDQAGGDSLSDADTIQKILGQKGTVKGGVLQVSIARPEHIKTHGVEVPASMGMATALNFQAAEDGKVIATGDFVLNGEEVNRVAKTLTERNITVTALHNHLVHESPDLYFMHFWAHDTAEKVAGGLKAGLGEMKMK